MKQECEQFFISQNAIKVNATVLITIFFYWTFKDMSKNHLRSNYYEFRLNLFDNNKDVQFIVWRLIGKYYITTHEIGATTIKSILIILLCKKYLKFFAINIFFLFFSYFFQIVIDLQDKHSIIDAILLDVPFNRSIRISDSLFLQHI